MTPFWIGIQYGVFLSLLVGPLLVVLVQTGVERGIQSGLIVGLGIWISDLLFIFSVYYCFSQWNEIVEWPFFIITVGTIGSLILVLSGLFTLRKAQPSMPIETISHRAIGRGFMRRLAITPHDAVHGK